MTSKSFLTRRFIRIKATHNLYAFYLARQANYACALDQIHNAFIPDVFADPPEDKTQLAQGEQQALALFTASFATPQSPPTYFAHHNSRVIEAVMKALTSYKSETAKDLHKLKRGLEKAADEINQACVRILQLLVKWAQVSQKQAERPRLNQQHSGILTAGLHNNRILQRLQADDAFIKLVQPKVINWQKDPHFIEGWYNQFVKKNLLFLRHLAAPTSPQQEEQLLMYLIEHLIFNNEVIQEFFNDLDLSWTAHKQIVKKMVRAVLRQVNQGSKKNTNFIMLDSSATWEEEQYFYTNLVTRTLEKDQDLEALITQKTKNWTVDRLVLLDKAIIKLAMCEMLYFSDIPLKVSMDEYIELSKTYSTPKSSQFVNGLLDAVAATLSQVS